MFSIALQAVAQSGTDSLRVRFRYDPARDEYTKYQSLNGVNISPPSVMTRKQYNDMLLRQEMRNYYKQKHGGGAKGDGEAADVSIIPKFQIDSPFFESLFGGDEIIINPQGSVVLDLGMTYQHIDNPMVPVRNRSNLNFDFNQNIQANVAASFGQYLNIKFAFDTKAVFAFQNAVKLDYAPSQDHIVQKIEVGNISMESSNSLVRGSQNLFGAKAQFRLGNTLITGIFSEQKSNAETIIAQGNGVVNEFEIYLDAYDENRHFFLSQYFYENYDKALLNYPYINSRVNITRMEVWVSNRASKTEGVRNIVAVQDLGEYKPYNPNIISSVSQQSAPENALNSVDPARMPSSIRSLSGVSSVFPSGMYADGTDYLVLENARLLTSGEYIYNPVLGYISLSRKLGDDEVLAASFEYTLDGKTYRVGELSSTGPQAPDNLVVKMLKSNISRTDTPVWKLMMKNIYSLEAFGLSQEDFRLALLYYSDAKGSALPYFDDPGSSFGDRRLLNIFNFDRLNANGNVAVGGDGIFDFIEGVTVDAKNARIIFTKAEPLGSYIEQLFNGQQTLIDKYAYKELYSQPKSKAQERADKNKFFIKGRYRSNSASEGIPLGTINVAPGSVMVRSGGMMLTEGIDYSVDYMLGTIRILNQSLIASDAPIEIQIENNSTYNLVSKRYMGLNIEQRIGKNLMADFSVMNLKERPLTQNSNYGYEPVNNTMLGFSVRYQTKAPFLTRVADVLTPFQNMQEESRLQVVSEWAYLIPGAAKGSEIGGEAASYIDDFEGSQSVVDLKGQSTWHLASTPQGIPEIIPTGNFSDADPLRINFNRGQLSWYSIDPLFYNSGSSVPDYFKRDKSLTSSDYTRRVMINEVFPNRDLTPGSIATLQTLDLAYYPEERGAYNHDFTRLEPDGMFTDGFDPKQNWAGVMRALTTSNFEEANVNFIEFWMMDPFGDDYAYKGNEGAKLYLHLGNISEDILKDSRKSFENGNPADGNPQMNASMEQTPWGFVSNSSSYVNTFENDVAKKAAQDVGLNGMNDEFERKKFPDATTRFHPGEKVYEDPSGDNFFYYRSSAWDNQQADLLTRYKYYSNPQGDATGSTMPAESYPTNATNMPDTEDINDDKTLNTVESYYQWEVSLDPKDLAKTGSNYISTITTVDVKRPDGTTRPTRWIQFKIPVATPNKAVGGISDLRSMRFMRMLVTQAQKPVVLRFAELRLVRNDWRLYSKELKEGLEGNDLNPAGKTTMDVNVVNIEQNDKKTPVPYVLPPNIERQMVYNGTYEQTQNEQSLRFVVKKLDKGDSRAVYRRGTFDMRNYGTIKMYVHGEATDSPSDVSDDEVSVFVRLGQDYDKNYYQYELPLKMTRWGASATEMLTIWPEANNLEIVLEELVKTKTARDGAINSGAQSGRDVLFSQSSGNKTLSVKGSPNLAEVRCILIGVVNRSAAEKSVEIWTDEMRFTSLNEKGAWATNNHLTFNLSSLASFTGNFSYATAGFGGIDQRVSERSQSASLGYDIMTSINAGLFFPETWRVRLPVYYATSRQSLTPKYHPLDPDVLFSDYVSGANDVSPHGADSLKNSARDITTRTTVSVTNAGQNARADKKTHFYELENFSVSYGFTQATRRNIEITNYFDRWHTGSIDYNWTTKPYQFRPLWSARALSSPHLQLFRDFNFSLYPSRVYFKVMGERRYSEESSRPLDDYNDFYSTLYSRNFRLGYQMGVTFPLTQSFNIDFIVNSNSYIPEGEGPLTSSERDAVMKSFWGFGEKLQYHHRLILNYRLPFDKLPWINWLETDLNSTTDYDWRATGDAFRKFQTEEGRPADLGNIAQNAGEFGVRGRLNFERLYSKFTKGEGNGRNNTVLQNLRNPSSQAGTGAGGSRKKGGDYSLKNIALNFVMMVKDISVNYTDAGTTLLPGFMPEPGFLSQGTYNGGWAPNLPFVLGSQTDVLHEAFLRGWLSADSRLNNQPYSRSSSQRLAVRANIQPLRKLVIDLEMTRDYYSTENTLFSVNYDQTSPDYGLQTLSKRTYGNFTISFPIIATSFKKAGTESSETFGRFLENRKVIAERLSAQYGTPAGVEGVYPTGFSEKHPEVLTYAFLSAYSGSDPSSSSMDVFGKFPIPNWNIRYTGLTDINFLKKYFTNITLSSAYRSLLRLNNYESNPLFVQGAMNFMESGELATPYLYNTINISEQFNPLVRVDVTMKNSLSVRGEVKRDRMLSLDLGNNLLTEVAGKEIGVGLGYTVRNLTFYTKNQWGRQALKSDLNLRADVSYRNTHNVIRNILDEPTSVTGGENFFIFKFSAEYNFTKQFSATFFWEQLSKKYRISTSFPTMTYRGGFSLRYNLGN